MHKHITKWKQVYGPVYTVWQPQPVVYIQDFEHIKDALLAHGKRYVLIEASGDDYLGRPQTFQEQFFMCVKNGGVFFSQGQQWHEERRRSLQILRDFGLGQNLMEEQVRISIQECVEHIKSLPNKSRVDMRWPIQLLVSNVMAMTLFGFHYKYDDCERLVLLSE